MGIIRMSGMGLVIRLEVSELWTLKEKNVLFLFVFFFL